MKRIVFDCILGISIFICPWWVSFGIAGIGIFVFSTFYEFICAGIIIYILSVPQVTTLWIAHPFPYTAILCAIYLALTALRRSIIFYTTS